MARSKPTPLASMAAHTLAACRMLRVDARPEMDATLVCVEMIVEAMACPGTPHDWISAENESSPSSLGRKTSSPRFLI